MSKKFGAAMLYSREMAKSIRQIKAPYKGIRLAISDAGDHLEILVREENIMSFSVDQRVAILEYLTMIETMLNSFPGVKAVVAGIPNV